MHNLRKLLAFLQDIEDQQDFQPVPIWKAHTLRSDSKDT